ncbi:MAG: acyl carrier protein, partial [Streptomyces sp.]|nr:acyl carrier protein [Streptomyces sp.]
VPVAALLDDGALRRQAADGMLNPLLRDLVRAPAATQRAAAAGRRPVPEADDLARLSGDDLDGALTELVKKHVFAVLSLPDTERFSPGQAFSDIGFDSLTAVELRNRLSAATGRRLPATLTFDYPDPKRLIGYLRDQFAPEADAVATGAPDSVISADIDRLEAALAAASTDPGTGAGTGVDHAEITRRLKDLLRVWQGRTPAGAPAGPAGLDSLSDQELLGVLDEELGGL